MTYSKQLTAFLEDSRQKEAVSEISEFFIEFLKMWDFLHQKAPELGIHDLKKFSKSILDEITLPFYKKFKHLKFLEKNDAWINEYATLNITHPRYHGIMFPLRLITYEIVNHEEKLFEFFIQKIKTGEIQATDENLFNFLLPRLVHVVIPLSSTDLLILKSYQSLENNSRDYFKSANTENIANYVQVSVRNLIRKLNTLNFCQIVIPVHFLNMAKLGYETFLISHFEPIPKDLTNFTLFSFDLTISQFSLFQVPLQNNKIYLRLQDELKPTIFHQMTDRIHSWNLSGLGPGKNGWKIPPSFLHSDPSAQTIAPSPTLTFSLVPEFDRFRNLTSADIKILEFITTKGTFSSKKHLSETVKVSLPEVSRRLEEYRNQNLISKVYQYFNLGLDLHINFCLTTPSKDEISWIDHFLSFPKTDVFYNIDNDSSIFFGHLKLPNKWYKDFTRKISRIKKEFNELKFYYSVEPGDLLKWNLLPSETYS
jgi:DNA-binding Lrp family transcriptional regulator